MLLLKKEMFKNLAFLKTSANWSVWDKCNLGKRENSKEAKFA